jgi:hypothetical protein
MKKIIIIIVALIMLKTYGQNHYLGIDAGIYMANIASKDFKPSYRTTFAGGISYEYFFNKSVSVGAGAVYSLRGYTTKAVAADTMSNGGKSKTKFDYISLPLKLGFTFGNKFFGFGKIGLVPAVLIKAQTTAPVMGADGEVIENKTENLTNKIRRMDIGGIVEIGGGYNLTERCRVKVSFSYQHSFSSITTDNYHPNSAIRNRGMSLSLGLAWALTNGTFKDDEE